MSLSKKINEIISKNEEVYWNNEFQIQLYMSKKYLLAFKAAAIIESGEFDKTFPPPTHVVADLGADKIDNHNMFIEEFFEVITKLSKGLTMSNGDFD